MEMRCLELEEMADKWEGVRLESAQQLEQEKEASRFNGFFFLQILTYILIINLLSRLASSSIKIILLPSRFNFNITVTYSAILARV